MTVFILRLFQLVELSRPFRSSWLRSRSRATSKFERESCPMVICISGVSVGGPGLFFLFVSFSCYFLWWISKREPAKRSNAHCVVRGRWKRSSKSPLTRTREGDNSAPELFFFSPKTNATTFRRRMGLLESRIIKKKLRKTNRKLYYVRERERRGFCVVKAVTIGSLWLFFFHGEILSSSSSPPSSIIIFLFFLHRFVHQRVDDHSAPLRCCNLLIFTVLSLSLTLIRFGYSDVWLLRFFRESFFFSIGAGAILSPSVRGLGVDSHRRCGGS